MSVMVLVLVAAVAAAVRVMLCGVPGFTVMDAGAAVTPMGRPERTTAAEEVKPLIAVVETATCWALAPAVRAMVAGAAEREKSAAGAGLELGLQPIVVNARQPKARIHWLNERMLEGKFFLKIRVWKSMRLLLYWSGVTSRVRFDSDEPCDGRGTSPHHTVQTSHGSFTAAQQ